MTHPHGIMTFVPGGQFNFPRSYVTKLKVSTNHVNVPSYADGLITWVHSPLDAVIAYTKLKDAFLPWSSNTYSLDWLVEYWYYQILPSPVEFEWGGSVRYAFDVTNECACVVIATEAADTDYFYDLAPAPTGYWPTLP
jgi:hypothetical protein